MSDRFGNRFLNCFRTAHVCCDCKSFSAGVVDGFGCRLEMVERAADQRNRCAGFRQRSRNAASDASAAAGYERDVAVKNTVQEYFVSHMIFVYALFGVRRQSEAATALWVSRLSAYPGSYSLCLIQSGVALRLPPHSTFISRRR